MATDSQPLFAGALRDRPVAADQPAVAALLSATDMFTAVEIELAVSLLRAPAEEDYQFLFLDQQTELLGFACYGLIPGTDSSYDLYWIGVHPSHQGHGYGRYLLTEVERAARQSGGERLYVDTSGRPQYVPTRKFYLAAGYRVVAELPDFYRQGDGKTIFCKMLEASQERLA